MAENDCTEWRLEFYDCLVDDNLKGLRQLVKTYSIDLNARITRARDSSHLKSCPIHIAAGKGHMDILQYLYEMKCNIHGRTVKYNRTAVHCAVRRNQVSALRYLLSIGLDPDFKDVCGISPCHIAAVRGDAEILEVLTQCAIDVNAQDSALKTPLMKAVCNGKNEAVKVLVKSGCNVNLWDSNKDTALHFASRHSHCSCIRVLLEAGADINAQNQWGNTAVMEAYRFKQVGAMELLLSSDADVNLCEFRNGNSVLHIAVQDSSVDIVEKLLQTKRTGHVYNNKGELALFDAVSKNKFEIIKCFLMHSIDFDIPVKQSPVVYATNLALQQSHYHTLNILYQAGYMLRAPYPQCRDHIQNTDIVDVNDKPDQMVFDLPGPLLIMCKKLVRRILGTDIVDKVVSLPIPERMQGYLLLKDLF